MDEADRADLISLLESIRRLLEHLVTTGYVSAVLQEDFIEAIRPLAERVGTVTTELRSTQHDPALERNGLSGAELRVKKRGYRRSLRRFIRLPSRRTVMRALEWANIFLGSLANVITLAEPIKELKEAIEASIKDTGDEPPPSASPPKSTVPTPPPALMFIDDAFSDPPEE